MIGDGSTHVEEPTPRRAATSGPQVRSRSLVANARDDLPSDDSDLEAWVASADDVAVRVDSEGDFAPTDVKRLSRGAARPTGRSYERRGVRTFVFA